MKGRAIAYSTHEREWLSANRSLPITEYHAAFSAIFSRPDVKKAHLHALRKRNGWTTGRTGRFEKGIAPHNKGKPCAPGEGGRHPNAVKTQFRPGHRGGKAALNYKPIGSERVSKEGYLERKVHDGRPFQSRWQTIQRINWEAANGPLPKGMILKCLDGNRQNVAAENWRAMPRSTLPYLSGRHGMAYDAAHPEIRPSIIALAELRHGVNSAKAGVS